MVAELPEAVRRGRGERWVEGVFGLHARHVGNAVGYDTIAASGDHACTLHWIRNDGDLREGDLLLLDAGVELDSLYTADVTRTLPVNGRFSDDQRMVYEAVLEAQQAGHRRRAGRGEVLRRARGGDRRASRAQLHEWGLLPVTAEESLSEDGGQHRRWMVHGTSHHLGIDVHDCAQARREDYREGTLAGAWCITVEPGLYFKPDDELVPAQLRGHRRPDRGRHRDHRDRQREPVGRAAAHQRRRRGVDGHRWCGPGRPDRHDHRAGAAVSAGDLAASARQAGTAPLLSKPPSSVIAWAWYVDGVRKPAESLTEAARLACVGDGFVWLGLKEPTDADLLALSSQFPLHPLAIEDAVHGHTRSKLEIFGDDLFMVISTVSYVAHEKLTETSEVVATGQVMIFLGDHFVITVRRGEQAPLSALRRSLEADPARLARGPSEVLYAITDKIIDDYLDVVAEFEQDVDEAETWCSPGGSHEVERVYQLKRELIEFKRSVMPLGAPLLRLATRDLPVIPPEAKAYFRELADHHTEAREAVASFDEVLTSILQAGLARASVADNEDMRKISGWVAIVAVPTMIAGIYGMNFTNMPELHTRYGYFVVLGVIAIVMVGLYAGFRRNNWL